MIRLVLLRFFESYFRHRWLNLLPILLLLAVGVLYDAMSPPKYETSGRLYVERSSLLASLTSSNQDGSWWMTASQLTINELNELLATRAFVRSAIQKTDLEARISADPQLLDTAIELFRTSIWISSRGDKLIEIGATTREPELAQQMVFALMDSYLQWKLNSDYQESVAAQAFFQNQIKPYEEKLQRARDELTAFLDMYPEPVRGERPPEESIELARLTEQVNQAEERLKSALDNEESARLAMAKSESVTRQTYLMIDKPDLPLKPRTSMRDRVISLVIFMIVGIILSIAGIAGGALIDRSLRFPIDVRHGLNLPVLAMVPTASFDAGQLAAITERQPQQEALAGRSAAAAINPALQPQLAAGAPPAER